MLTGQPVNEMITMRLPFSIFIGILPVFAIAQADTSAIKPTADSAKSMAGVTVSAAVSSKQLKQQPVNVSVVDSRPFYNTNFTGLDLLRQTSGIKVRQAAGYGSGAEFFINGSTGKQVKYFVDGLPQDNLGETQGLSIIPLEQTERIEVYKGILPVDLGGDALGAAINIVTRREREDYINASYAASSFNTHKLNFGGKKFFGEHFFAGIQAAAAYSDNNYKIDADVYDNFGNPHPVTVPRFHDAFRNFSVRGEAGWINTSWADAAGISLVSSGLHRELQSNIVMTQPYGKAVYQEQLWSAIARYSKRNLFKHTDVSAYVSYNKVSGLFRDTSQNVYDWYGAVTDRKLTGGEIVSSGNELYIHTDVINAKLSAAYRATDDLKIVLSNTFQYYNRTGRDTVAKRYYGGVDFYDTPSSLIKNISGLGIEGRMSGQLKFTAAIKYLLARSEGYTLNFNTQTISRQSVQAISYNAGFAYRLNESVLLKTSYEHAARLPEADEMFGDLMIVRPNPDIQPEISDNINLNIVFNSSVFNLEAGGFYRYVQDIIYLRPALTSAMYQNLLKARVKGIEAVMVYSPFSFLSMNGNVTFQDLRNQSFIDGGGINNERYKNARLPNIPYLFANGGVRYTMKVSGDGISLQGWYNIAYTHEYFLYWEVDGAREMKNRIPEQLLHYAGITAASPQKGLSLSFEINNLTDRKAYDSFKAQLPGRAFSIKLRYYITEQLKK
ncbi:MAG: cobalamin receptor protein [Citrobacter freundii]|nr:MAG: cobalamin receptor protein [Citrobacter freundii]